MIDLNKKTEEHLETQNSSPQTQIWLILGLATFLLVAGYMLYSRYADNVFSNHSETSNVQIRHTEDNQQPILMLTATQFFLHISGLMTLIFGVVAGHQLFSGSQPSKTSMVVFLVGFILFGLLVIITNS